MSVNDGQKGGDHYHSEFQHWDLIEESGIGYLEAAATKYVGRWRKKGTPRLDLEKSLHYTEKLIELNESINRVCRGIAPIETVERYCRINNLGVHEARFTMLLCRWTKVTDLYEAVVVVHTLIQVHDKFVASRQSHEDNTGMDHPYGYEEGENGL